MTKRIWLDTGYFETYNRDDVVLVSFRDSPVAEGAPTGCGSATAAITRPT